MTIRVCGPFLIFTSESSVGQIFNLPIAAQRRWQIENLPHGAAPSPEFGVVGEALPLLNDTASVRDEVCKFWTGRPH